MHHALHVAYWTLPRSATTGAFRTNDATTTTTHVGYMTIPYHCRRRRPWRAKRPDWNERSKVSIARRTNSSSSWILIANDVRWRSTLEGQRPNLCRPLLTWPPLKPKERTGCHHISEWWFPVPSTPSSGQSVDPTPSRSVRRWPWPVEGWTPHTFPAVDLVLRRAPPWRWTSWQMVIRGWPRSLGCRLPLTDHRLSIVYHQRRR